MKHATLVVLAAAMTFVAAAKEEKPDRIGLEAYVPSGEIARIPGVPANASGLACDTKTGTFFVVVDGPAKIVAFSPPRKQARVIRLKGFADPEGIAFVKKGLLAVVEEGWGTLCLIRVGPDTTAVSHDQAEVIEIDRTGGNEGLEGLAYDPGSECFYVVKEKRPKKIYKVTREGKVSTPWDIEKDGPPVGDLSAVFFHEPTGHLVLVSHESHVALECTTEGKVLSQLRLPLVKPEGITMDADGVLYVCGEPNDLQKFVRK
jgi:uncharacterized protein YjiK